MNYPLPTMVIAAAVFVIALYYAIHPREAGTDGPPKPQPPSQPLFIKDLDLNGTLHPDAPIQIAGEIAATTNRLRFFVDVSTLSYQRWQQRIRMPVAELNDAVKGNRFDFTIANYKKGTTHGAHEFFWGDPAKNFPVSFGLTRLRLAIIGPDQKEQHFYYLVFRGAGLGTDSYPPDGPRALMILKLDQLDWVAQWQNED